MRTKTYFAAIWNSSVNLGHALEEGTHMDEEEGADAQARQS